MEDSYASKAGFLPNLRSISARRSNEGDKPDFQPRRISYQGNRPLCDPRQTAPRPTPDRPHTSPIPPGLLQSAPGRTKKDGRMENAESGGRLCPAMRENHAPEGSWAKPPQG